MYFNVLYGNIARWSDIPGLFLGKSIGFRKALSRFTSDPCGKLTVTYKNSTILVKRANNKVNITDGRYKKSLQKYWPQ